MFFFSSRRRHTRFDCDWSSDVCSSDLSQEIQFTPSISHNVLRRTSSSPTTMRFFSGSIESRSEEHTSELQSQSNLVCRLLLEKKKKNQTYSSTLSTLYS